MPEKTLAAALLVLVLSVAGHAQTTPSNPPQWNMIDLGVPRDRAGHDMVYDSKRGVCVSYGGYWQYGSGGNFREYKHLDNIIEYDGKRWVRRANSSAPGKRFFHSMAYDSKRGVTVLFGGGDADLNFAKGTWEWNGDSWKECECKTSPPARTQFAMCFDSKRGVVVLFGGNSADGILQDTWEYDGADWKQAKPAAKPGERAAHAMAYDSKRGVCVMHGGIVPGKSYLADLWEYDGKTWTERKAEGSPGERANHKMVFDSKRGVTVMFSGDISDSRMASGSPQEWDGESWNSKMGNNPVPRSKAGLAYDSKRGVTVLFGGSTGRLSMRDTREYDANGWTEFEPAWPAEVIAPAAAYDPQRGATVTYWGNNDLLLFDGVKQTRLATQDGPLSAGSKLVYDANRKSMVLFGGISRAKGLDNGTHVLEGDKWRKVEGVSPPGRTGHAMAYDSKREVVVLFGGFGANRVQLGDAWEFDGKQWRQVELPKDSGPAPRLGHAMAFDSKRGVIVLFGGISSENMDPCSDTWEYDGKAWTRSAATTSPPARGHHAMAYDDKSGLVVLHGGQGSSEVFDDKDAGDTWTFDGKQWRELKCGGTPRYQAAMAYDSKRGVLVAVGGVRKGRFSGLLELSELSLGSK